MGQEKMVRIRNVEDFVRIFGLNPKDVALKGISEIEEMYVSSRNLFEFAEKIIDYVGLERSKDGYKKAFVIASTIDAMVNALSEGSNNGEEMMYG